MPAMVDAFRADCTIGETQGLLKEVLGYGYYGHGRMHMTGGYGILQKCFGMPAWR